MKVPTWQRAAAAGLLLGLAELAKMTWIFLFLLWPALWILWRFTSRRDLASSGKWLSASTQLVVILALGLYILNFGYAFDGTLTKLRDFTFVSKSLTELDDPGTPGNRFAELWEGGLRIPVPHQYVLGIDAQKRDFEDFHSPSYLRGEWKQGGWWYYYLYAIFVKTPHGMQCLFLAVIAALALGKLHVRRRDSLVLLAPGALIVAIASFETGINHHMRYVLPFFGFGLVLLGASFLFLINGRNLLRIPTAALLLWSICSSAFIYPHSLAYFNELAGGPQNGHRHLLHSNIDWGQDLLMLKIGRASCRERV
jgi:4-amino-4-deoxy-L-arabinose transferase-like glycosyltransferase